MSATPNDLTRYKFAKTFVLPGLSVFLVPILSLCFFVYGQDRIDRDAREAILKNIHKDSLLSPNAKAQLSEFYEKVPFSELATHSEFAQNLDTRTKFDFFTFRWMIRISKWSILAGVLVFAVGGICVALSLRSQFVQYLSLSIGWHVLRIFSALQTIAQGTMLVALSYWVTALWFNVYVPKLIGIVAILAVVAMFMVIKAIFTTPHAEFVVGGKVIDKDQSPKLWERLQVICDKVGTSPPDQVIAGIDDNFFVTENPVTVQGKNYDGRTLFISLALLKQLHSAEADAILAHEMAHFSGNDTLYSRKISPLLQRYGHYLQALSDGGALPILYFMLCFRALFELSLGALSRKREFRADKIAADTTSANDMAGALLRTTAYSRYRTNVENDLFNNERALESANISERVERGFPKFAVGFASDPQLASAETSHQFDSHPPLQIRLEAVGLPKLSDAAQSLLTQPGDGGWYQNIENADEIEREQWKQFEESFRALHEQSLPYRFLPQTDQERTIVVRAFPEMLFEGKDGTLIVDYLQIQSATWAEPVLISELRNLELDDYGLLTIDLAPIGKKLTLKTAQFPDKQLVIDTIGRYYGRYITALEYLKFKAKEAESK